MNKTADTWVEIHFKENSIPSIIAGPLTKKSKQALLKDILALIGEDERVFQTEDINYLARLTTRNQLRAELRQKIRQYFSQDNQGGKI